MPTPEELLASLKVRGFEKGFQRTPLREFIATLENITGDMVETRRGPKQQIIYNFIDVEVIESVEPYPFPIAQLSIMDNIREQSAMGVFGTSVDRVLNPGIPKDSLKFRGQGDLIDKKLHMKLTGGHMMWDPDKGEETPRDCWELVGMEGGVETSTGAKADATARALELLDGKNMADWNQIVFQDPTVKADGELVTTILNNTFIPSMKEAGIVSEDGNGIFHLIKTGG